MEAQGIFHFCFVFFPYTQEIPLGGERPTSLQLNTRTCVKQKSHSVFPYLNKRIKIEESDKNFNTEIVKFNCPTSKISSDKKVFAVVENSRESRDKRGLGCLHTHTHHLPLCLESSFSSPKPDYYPSIPCRSPLLLQSK